MQYDVASMIIECCSQERSYRKFFGLLGQVSILNSILTFWCYDIVYVEVLSAQSRVCWTVRKVVPGTCEPLNIRCHGYIFLISVFNVSSSGDKQVKKCCKIFCSLVPHWCRAVDLSVNHSFKRGWNNFVQSYLHKDPLSRISRVHGISEAEWKVSWSVSWYLIVHT